MLFDVGQSQQMLWIQPAVSDTIGTQHDYLGTTQNFHNVVNKNSRIIHSDLLQKPRHDSATRRLFLTLLCSRPFLLRLALRKAPRHRKEALPQIQCRALASSHLHALRLLLLEPTHRTLDVLPRLHARHKHEHADKCGRPFPRDPLVLEHADSVPGCTRPETPRKTQ